MKNKRILIVDNVRAILEREKTMLDRKDFHIFTATSGEEALKIHADEDMDAIIIDLRMPGMSGDDVCKKIRADKDLKRVSIIMATLSFLMIVSVSGSNPFLVNFTSASL